VTKNSTQDGTPKGENTLAGLRLAEINKAWPDLPEDVQRNIWHVAKHCRRT